VSAVALQGGAAWSFKEETRGLGGDNWDGRRDSNMGMPECM